MDLLVHELLRAPAGDEVESSLPLDADDVAVVGTPAGEPGAVREQVPEGHVGLPVHAEVVKEARYAIVELELPLAQQQHEGGDGGERLGERGEVEDRVGTHRRPFGLEAARAEGGVVEDLPGPADQDDRTGEGPRLDGRLEFALDGGEVHFASYATAGSRAVSRPRSVSSATSTPRGSARFSQPSSGGA